MLASACWEHLKLGGAALPHSANINTRQLAPPNSALPFKRSSEAVGQTGTEVLKNGTSGSQLKLRESHIKVPDPRKSGSLEAGLGISLGASSAMVVNLWVTTLLEVIYPDFLHIRFIL